MMAPDVIPPHIGIPAAIILTAWCLILEIRAANRPG